MDSLFSLIKWEENSNPDMSILAISNLLEGCSNAPQCFTSMSVTGGCIKPSLWFKAVTTALLDVRSNKNQALWIKCFHSLLIICPSVIEDDIQALIKTVLLNTSVHDSESKNQYCELFNIVLQAYSKLHQLPKFFVKLLLALTECIKEDFGGNLLENGQLLPQVQESIAKCIQTLPYGQMIELWKIFIETFSTLENMSHVFMVKKGFMFFVAQLFSSFLLHAQLFKTNIPTSISSQFITLIENTSAEIEKIASALTEKKSEFLTSQKSILLLTHAIGEVKLAYNAYYGKLLEKMDVLICEEPFDFSVLHNYLNKDYSSVLKKMLNCDNKILSSLVFQLLLQKIRALLQSKESLLNEDVCHLQKCISIILECLQESTAVDSWDLDICTVNDKNCGTTYWMKFLKVSPLLLKYLNSRDFYSLCSAAQNIILLGGSSENGAKFFILSSFKSESFVESKEFQTAFVSSIWKVENLISKKRSYDDSGTEQNSINKIFSLLNSYHSNALKYVQRTPKSNKKLGSTWNEIQEVSDLLNDILSQDSLPKCKLIINNIRDVLKLLACLPLEYLLPGNQMKCTIGVSLLLFLVPQSCKSDELIPLSKDICHTLKIILDGVRSIWLFDFVSTVSYFEHIVKTMELIMNYDNDAKDWIIQLIEQLVALIMRNVNSLEAVEPYISKLAVKKGCSRATQIVFYTLLSKFPRVLSRLQKQENDNKIFVKVASVTLQSFIKQMEINLNENMENDEYSYFIKCYIHVIEIICGASKMVDQSCKKCFEFFPAILEKALIKVKSYIVDEVSDLYLLFISKVCKYSDKLSKYLPENFLSISWKIVLYYLEEKRKRKMEDINTYQVFSTKYFHVLDSKLCSLCSCISNHISVQVKDKKLQQVKEENSNQLLLLALNDFEQESLKVLSQISTSEVLVEEVLHIFIKEMKEDNIKTVDDVFLMHKIFLILQCIIDANSDIFQQPLLNKPIQDLLSLLIARGNQCCSSVVCQKIVVIPILEFINFIVKGNKGFPKEMLLQSLHSVAPLTLKVCDDNYELFVDSFNAAWNVVYNLYVCHTPIISGVPAILLVYVKKLLKSIVEAAGDFPLSKCDANTLQKVQLCAENMTRLLTVITRQKSEFSKLVPYLITYYVDTAQQFTLNSHVKESILLGIYRLLDICSEDSIKMQAVNIDSVSREVYGNLIRNYRQNKQKAFG